MAPSAVINILSSITSGFEGLSSPDILISLLIEFKPTPETKGRLVKTNKTTTPKARVLLNRWFFILLPLIANSHLINSIQNITLDL